MTDNEVHEALVAWISGLTGVTVIKAHQSGPAPALPYIMINHTGTVDVRDHAAYVDYTDTGAPIDPEDEASKTKIRADVEIETEWRFSVHAYGAIPPDILRPLKSAAKLAQINEPLLPGLHIHEAGIINNVPDWINDAWEPRAQMPIYVRGVTTEGFVVDTIDDTSFNVSRA